MNRCDLPRHATCRGHELGRAPKKNEAYCLLGFRSCGRVLPLPVHQDRPFLLRRVRQGAICSRGSTIKTRHNDSSPLEA